MAIKDIISALSAGKAKLEETGLLTPEQIDELFGYTEPKTNDSYTKGKRKGQEESAQKILDLEAEISDLTADLETAKAAAGKSGDKDLQAKIEALETKLNDQKEANKTLKLETEKAAKESQVTGIHAGINWADDEAGAAGLTLLKAHLSDVDLSDEDEIKGALDAFKEQTAIKRLIGAKPTKGSGAEPKGGQGEGVEDPSGDLKYFQKGTLNLSKQFKIKQEDPDRYAALKQQAAG